MLMKNFKKLAAIFTVACLLVLSVTVSAAAATTVYGDANGDTDVNIIDLIRVKKHLANPTLAINVEAVDNDENGEVDTPDLIKLRKVLIGSEVYEISVVEGEISWPDSWDQ